MQSCSNFLIELLASFFRSSISISLWDVLSERSANRICPLNQSVAVVASALNVVNSCYMVSFLIWVCCYGLLMLFLYIVVFICWVYFIVGFDRLSESIINAFCSLVVEIHLVSFFGQLYINFLFLSDFFKTSHEDIQFGLLIVDWILGLIWAFMQDVNTDLNLLK